MVTTTGWVVGIALVVYGLAGIGVRELAELSHQLLFARGSDPYDQMYLVALPVCAVMGLSLIRNARRYRRMVKGVVRGERGAGVRAIAGRLLLGVEAVWAAFATLCVIVLPTTSELNPQDPWGGPIVLPIPDEWHGYLAPWRLPEGMPFRLGVAITLVVIFVVAGLVLRYGREATSRVTG